MSSARHDLRPRKVGRYRLIRKLGQGGMGAVYEAEHTKLRRRVALKVLTDRLAGDADAVRRFEREMRATGRVSHPGVVQALDADQVDGVAYLAMELVDGVDLAAAAALYEHDAGRLLPVGACCEAIRRAAEAVHAAHDAGLIHRDLKLSNLMLCRDGEVKVLDLGLASVSEDVAPADGPPLTVTGQIMGTVDYMAPEQAAGVRDLDGRADVYSLGATLYRLLSGSPPFPSADHPTVVSKLSALATTTPVPVSERRPDITPELGEVVAAAMNRERDRRPATAAALADRLRPFCDRSELQQAAAHVLSVADGRGAVETPLPSTASNVPEGETVIRTPDVGPDAETSEDIPPEAYSFVPSSDAGQGDLMDALAGLDERRPQIVWPAVGVLAVVAAATWFALRPASETAKPAAVTPEPAALAAAASSPASGLPPAEAPVHGLVFDGTDRAFYTPPLPPDLAENFTVELWVSSLHAPGEDGADDGYRSLAAFGPFALDALTDAGWRFSISSEDEGGIHSPEVRLSGGPTHIAGQWDGRTLRTFVDGRPLTDRVTKFGGVAERPDALAAAREMLADHPAAGLRLGGKTDPIDGAVRSVRVSRGSRYDGPFAPPATLAADGDTLVLFDFSDRDRSVEDVGRIEDRSGHGYNAEAAN